MSFNKEQREQFTVTVCKRAYTEVGNAIALLADKEEGENKETLKRTLSNAITFLAHALAVM